MFSLTQQFVAPSKVRSGAKIAAFVYSDHAIATKVFQQKVEAFPKVLVVRDSFYFLTSKLKYLHETNSWTVARPASVNEEGEKVIAAANAAFSPSDKERGGDEAHVNPNVAATAASPPLPVEKHQVRRGDKQSIPTFLREHLKDPNLAVCKNFDTS